MKPKGREKPDANKERGPDHAELDMLQSQLETLQNEKDQLFQKLQRVSADYANFQKRNARQVADTIVYEKETIMRTLLPALDSFEHTLQNVRSADNVKAVVKGIEIIYDQILAILASHGVEQIKALGEKFDPALHEAVMLKADPKKQTDVILEQFQTGYKCNGRVIRPSKVVVNKLAPKQQPGPAKTTPENKSGQTLDAEEEQS